MAPFSTARSWSYRRSPGVASGVSRGGDDDATSSRRICKAFASFERRVFRGDGSADVTLDDVSIQTLSSDRMTLSVDLDLGARVTELIDHATGRQWLLTGPRPGDTSETVVYRGAASRGWDECFPTVLPCSAPEWGGRLRDHGMLWGRPWRMVAAGPQFLQACYTGEGIRFDRRLELSGDALTASYAVASTRAAPVPYMWSQHCVLRVAVTDRITLSGQGRMVGDGKGFDWPDYPARDLSRVGPEDEGFVLKSYALTRSSAFAQVSGPKGGLRFDWDGAKVPALGLWLDYGGWPEEAPLHQLAIEPTTAAADDLSDAMTLGQERWLAPGDTHAWSVRLTLLDPEEGLAR